MPAPTAPKRSSTRTLRSGSRTFRGGRAPCGMVRVLLTTVKKRLAVRHTGSHDNQDSRERIRLVLECEHLAEPDRARFASMSAASSSPAPAQINSRAVGLGIDWYQTPAHSGHRTRTRSAGFDVMETLSTLSSWGPHASHLTRSLAICLLPWCVATFGQDQQ